MKKNIETRQQARSKKAATILRTVDKKDLEKVAGGWCITCGTNGILLPTEKV